ncbi:glycosyltransferase [Nocardioides sp. SR21]|uniref:glycosyltransferase n=1 Tax=Nocardioides sp. SR21 TaxID=2919501 RepID=UPI001FAA28FE|nr:glycosyltransferase [Nocardioides sp. SR21]
MRIALVTETFFPAVDGTTTTVKAVLDRLVDLGHQVLVIAPGPGLTTYRGCRIARVRPLDKPGSQVREAIDTFRPDLVHATSPGTVGRKALKHAGRLGVPTLAVEQSPTLSGVSADRMLVTSTWMLGGDRQLWAPGVDTAAFTPALRDDWLHDRWSKSGSRVVVGYVGALRKHHGARRLLALNEVPGIRPVVIGDGPQRGWLQAHLPGARFTGALGTGDLAAVLPALDVLVHPGEQETCCHALREAGASGVPVVAPRAGGALDVVRPLETGLFYDPGDEQALARAVAAIAADRTRALLGARARELSTRTWRGAADELVERHYRGLIGRLRPVSNKA